MSDNYPVDAELGRQAERIEAMEQAHAELAAKVERLSMKSSNTASLLREHCKWHISLESPAPAPDPVCANCGHGQGHHMGRTEFCTVDIARGARCSCRNFVPTAEAEPAPLDPVRLEAAAKALHETNGFVTPWDDLTSFTRIRFKHDAARAIRAYGKDGAR